MQDNSKQEKLSLLRKLYKSFKLDGNTEMMDKIVKMAKDIETRESDEMLDKFKKSLL